MESAVQASRTVDTHTNIWQILPDVREVTLVSNASSPPLFSVHLVVYVLPFTLAPAGLAGDIYFWDPPGARFFVVPQHPVLETFAVELQTSFAHFLLEVG